MKRMILFPGVGYHCDKPLLYYSRRLGEKYGFEVVPLSFTGFPSDIKGNLDKREEGYVHALDQAKEQLAGKLAPEADLVFVSKSIGTVAAMRLAAELSIDPLQILLTPLKETFLSAQESRKNVRGIVFHGTKDPLAVTEEIRELAEAVRLPLHLIADANHSLETGDVQTDLKIQQCVMHEIEKLLYQGAE